MQIPQISQLARDCGFTHAHVKRVLMGETWPSRRCARALAQALSVSVSELIEHIEPGARDPISLWPLEEE